MSAGQRRGIAILVLASMAFAVMAVLVRVAARDMPSTQIACLRFLGSLVLLRALAGRRRLRPRALATVLQRGVLGALAVTCYFYAIEHVGAGLATLVHCTYPVWTACFAVLFLGEPTSWRLAAALALDLIGLVLVVGPSAQLAGVSTAGLAVGLLGSLLSGGAVATASLLRASEDALLITIYFMAVGVAMTAPALLAGLPPLSPGLVAVLVGVVVTSAAGQWLLHEGLGFTSASLGSLTAATGVFTTAALEALVLGEPPRTAMVLGGALMIAAVGLAAGSKRVEAAVRRAA